MFSFARGLNLPLVSDGEKKHGQDPYWDLFVNEKPGFYERYGTDKFLDPYGEEFDGPYKQIHGDNKGKQVYSEADYAAFVRTQVFNDEMKARTKAAVDEMASGFEREGAPAGAGAEARDYGSYSAITFDDFSEDDKKRHPESVNKAIEMYGSDPYFADYIAEGNSVFGTNPSNTPGFKPKAGVSRRGFIEYIEERKKRDATQARIDAANATTDTTDTTDLTGLTGSTGSGGTLLELINSGLSESEAIELFLNNTGTTDTTDTGTIGELTGGGEVANVTQGLSAEQIAQGYTYGDSRGSFVTPDGVVFDNPQFDANGYPIFSVPDTTTGTLNEVTSTVNQGYNESLSAEDVGNLQRGGVGPNDQMPVNGIFYNDAGEVTGFLTEADRAAYNEAQQANQNPIINIAGSLYDYDGNFVGTDPNVINVGGSLYDRQGNYLGPAQSGATGETIGGASPGNVIFDPYTAEQEAAQARAAEAVELMDAGYGRYNAAIRKLGIVGRQGEEYAPLILDQLRMAEQEAAQPQLAAFGFGLNPQLGGMPQIGVQGVQGNTGGQSALTSISNAGLNQLQLAQQPYNRISLPAIDSATGLPDFSQVNNPTIFQASTNV